MNKLTSSINTDYIIVFVDGSKKRITKEDGDKILIGSTRAEKFFLSGQMYKFTQVAKIIPLSEYYEQYPEERKDNINYTFPNGVPEIKTTTWTRYKYTRAIELMIAGFKKNFHGRIMPEQSKKMLERIEERLTSSVFDKSEGRGNPVDEFMSALSY